ncbi:hypothetical protein TIFTF001_020560 [Ficus carica]|uniref:DUF8039 domain-containing protein n=1 Tax=Ficus carica TaxID=3494 RepID=A0AA88D9X4_FICCA|nr:hypothetical protein TIFTF001_020560 [Ficus carica]
MSQDHEEEYSTQTQTQIGKPRRTNSPRFNTDEDGKRRATLMRRVHHVRIKRERIEVSFDAKGQPLGKEGDELQSWIGVLAREHIPIWISDFRSADLAPRKERVWVEIDDWEKLIEYRRTLEFKRLSEQGSEIRKKSKYRSTGGRDGYRKCDQAHFERTGKWAERHTRWLDMHVKPNGEFKNEAFKIIADTIALGNAEHSGRIRGQSKFVKQSQYFNLVQSSRENVEVSDMKRQLVALERTVQELCAKHGINRETMAEESTAPTVDQHNSFKASCTLNEKEAGSSNPKPMPNASKECQLFLPDLVKLFLPDLVNGGHVLVAIDRAYMDCVPTDIVHGIPLGEENVRVILIIPKLKRALLPIPTNEATCIEEAVGGFVAWPKRLVVVQTSLSQASQGPGHAPDREAKGSKRTKKRAWRKKIQSQPEVQQQPAHEELPSFDFSEIPFELRHLAYYA